VSFDRQQNLPGKYILRGSQRSLPRGARKLLILFDFFLLCFTLGNVIIVLWGKVDLSFPREEFYAPLPGNHFFDDLANVEPRVQVIA